MKEENLLPPSLLDYLASVGQTPIGPFVRLQGGAISATLRFTVNSGYRYVAKCLHDGPADLYAKEADGLQALSLPGCPSVPKVIAVGQEFLLLEDLGSGQRSPTYWEDFGRQMATLHKHTSESFGYNSDNYLGLATQCNERTDDGYEFYIRRRVLRYINEGKCKEVLTREDRKRLDRFCNRLRELVPSQSPSLCHGDLWHGNVVITDAGDPAYVDPAVYYGWAEADLGMTTQYEKFDARFYDAYEESGVLAAGWRDRLEIYHIKEWLSMVAHFGEERKSLFRLRRLLREYT